MPANISMLSILGFEAILVGVILILVFALRATTRQLEERQERVRRQHDDNVALERDNRRLGALADKLGGRVTRLEAFRDVVAKALADLEADEAEVEEEEEDEEPAGDAGRAAGAFVTVPMKCRQVTVAFGPWQEHRYEAAPEETEEVPHVVG